MAGVVELEAKIDLAVTHIGNAAWGDAETVLLQAEALMAAIPLSEKGGREGSRLEYNATYLARLLAHVRSRRHAATGIQRTNIKYKRETTNDD